MRIIFATLFFLMCSGQALFAQKFSLSELILLVDKNLDDFDSFVNAKNYKYNRTETETKGKSYSYSYNRSKYNSTKAKYWISKYEIADKNDPIKDWISWQTLNQKDYLAIKKQLKEKGFTLYEATTFKDYMNTTYRKGEIEVSIFSGTQINELGHKGNFYEINVKRLW